jgi:hypothetical protein
LDGILWHPLTVQAICPVSCRRFADDFFVAADSAVSEDIAGEASASA